MTPRSTETMSKKVYGSNPLLPTPKKSLADVTVATWSTSTSHEALLVDHLISLPCTTGLVLSEGLDFLVSLLRGGCRGATATAGHASLVLSEGLS